MEPGHVKASGNIMRPEIVPVPVCQRGKQWLRETGVVAVGCRGEEKLECGWRVAFMAPAFHLSVYLITRLNV